MIQVYRCHFVGPIHANNLSLPNIDAIHLGGPGGPYQAGGSGDFVTSGQEGISSAGQFMGTGSTIIGCRFYNIRRGIWGRRAANQWTGTGLYFSPGCGDDDNGGAIVLEGTSPLIGAGAANILSPIIETTFYVHAIRLGFNASGNTVVGGNGLDGWTTGLAGGSTNINSATLPGAGGTPVLIVNPAFQDANMCAWKGKLLLLGAHGFPGVVGAITAFSLLNGGTLYNVGDQITLNNALAATVTAVDMPNGAVTGLLLGQGNTGWVAGQQLSQTGRQSGNGTGLVIGVTTVGSSGQELVTMATTPITGTTPSVGTTHVHSLTSWVRINLDQEIPSGAALIGDGIDNQEISSLTYAGTIVDQGVTYYQYACLPPLAFIHTAGELVTIAPFILPLMTAPKYPHGGGDSVSRTLSMHHLVQGYATTDTSGDVADSSPSYNTIITSGSSKGSDTVASYQDDTGPTTTNTIINSGHRSSPSVLAGNVRVTGSVASNVVSAGGNHACGPLDALIIVTATNKTVTLPAAAAAGSGKQITVKIAPGVSSTTVDVAGGGTIDGQTSYTLTSESSETSVGRFVSDGSVWYVV